MKTKLLRNRRAGALTLQILPSKHESLIYDQAEWLKGGGVQGLCTFEYRRDTASVLFYDLTGLVDLQTYLKAAISLSQYRLLLTSLASVLEACTQKGYPTAALLCDPSFVYVDTAGAPRFVYVPLAGMPERPENTPIALLRYLANKKHVTFAVASDASHAAALDDFVSRNAVLSLSAYRGFLTSEFGFSVGGTSKTAQAMGSAPRRPLTGTVGNVPPAANAATASPVAFDFVATLRQAPSAAQVQATQSVATQVRNAVRGVSPTAADQLNQANPDAVKPVPNTAAEKGKVASQSSGGTTLLGSFSALHPAITPSPSEQAPRSAWLVRDSDGMRLRLPDDNRTVVVGRSATCDMQFAGNSNVSRRHAELTRNGSRFEISDLGSANGTSVGGRKLAPGEHMGVRPNELFLLADESFRIVLD